MSKEFSSTTDEKREPEQSIFYNPILDDAPSVESDSETYRYVSRARLPEIKWRPPTEEGWRFIQIASGCMQMGEHND